MAQTVPIPIYQVLKARLDRDDAEKVASAMEPVFIIALTLMNPVAAELIKGLLAR